VGVSAHAPNYLLIKLKNPGYSNFTTSAPIVLFAMFQEQVLRIFD